MAELTSPINTAIKIKSVIRVESVNVRVIWKIA